MPGVDEFLFLFIVVVVVIGIGWFIYDARSDAEK
jgi:Na+-transporting methylmalonyl-CoA/oxaloacetate decarboxylase gamma subunit